MMSEDAFQRWQKITIDQLGYALNLILTFTVAALGYWFVLLRDADFVPASTAKTMMVVAFIGLALSAIAGLICIVNRLQDFRGTTQRARDASSAVAPTKGHLDKLGKLTWFLFYFQIGTFAVGIASLAIAILLVGGNKYEVIERSEKEVPNFGAPGVHTEVDYVLRHQGRRIYAACDVTTVDNLDPNARCGFRPLRAYNCHLGDDRLEKARAPLADLICKDSDDHNVYLYVDKEE